MADQPTTEQKTEEQKIENKPVEEKKVTKKEGNEGAGRPPTSEEDKKIMLQKLEPYLKSGLSVRKALIEAAIPSSTFYEIMRTDKEFLEQIDRFRQFVAVLANSALVKHLQDIIRRQSSNEKVTEKDIAFLQWFALNSSLTKEEFGERKDVNLYDPEAELQKLKSMLDEIPE